MSYIISASRRTDLPAFYAEWTYRRFREGYVIIKNPFNPHQISRISLKPSDVLGIVFWTRYFKPLEKYLDFFTDNFEFYIHYTLTNYPRLFEPHNPSHKKVIENIVSLSEKIGKDRIIWRYDPIFFTNKLNVEWHIENFTYLYSKLKNHVNEIYIASLFPYKKTLLNMKKIGEEVDNREENYRQFGLFLIKNVKIPIFSCASFLFEKVGIKAGSCVDKEKFLKFTREEIKKENLNKIKKQPTRNTCGCYESKDIGMYNTCLAGCVYCYATFNRNVALRNYRKHDPDHPVLIP